MHDSSTIVGQPSQTGQGESCKSHVVNSQDEVVADFRFVKASGDHKSSCRWVVKINGLILGEVVRFNLDCNGQIAWRGVNRVGKCVGSGRTRTDAAFGLLCDLDQDQDSLSFDALYGVSEYSLKAQNEGVEADCDLLSRCTNNTAEVLESVSGGGRRG